MAEVGRLGNPRTTPSPTLRELAALLFRHSRYAVLTFAVVFLASLLYALLAPNYEAHFKVICGEGVPILSSPPSLPLLISPAPPLVKRS